MTDTNNTPHDGDVTAPLPVQEPPVAQTTQEYAAPQQTTQPAVAEPWYRTGGGVAAIAVASALVAGTLAFSFGWGAHSLATAIHGPRGVAMMAPGDQFGGRGGGQGGPGMGFRGGPGGGQGMGRGGIDDRQDCPGGGCDLAPQGGQGFAPDQGQGYGPGQGQGMGRGRGRGWDQAPGSTAPTAPAPQGSSWSF